jgi:hypothetical protein
MKSSSEKLIKKMPDEETLEAFVRGGHQSPSVVFNRETGEFEWLVPRPDPRLGQPKTEQGWKWRRL